MSGSKQTLLKNNWSDLVKLQTDFSNLNLWPSIEARPTKNTTEIVETESVQFPNFDELQLPKNQKEIDNKLESTPGPSTGTPKLTKKQRIKQKIKNKNTISINLLDLLKKRTRERNQIKAKKAVKQPRFNPILQRKRGKVREKRLIKVLTPLKKNILLVRKQRKELLAQNNVVVPMQIEKNQQQIYVHSRKFRPYCDNMISKELATAVESLLAELYRFQDRAYKKNEIKGRGKRRYVVGFNEVTRCLEARKTKLVLVAPDIEPALECIEIDGESVVEKIKRIAGETEIPVVFSIARRKIGYLLHKKVQVSCVAILNYDGANDQVKEILRLHETERLKYKEFFL